MPFGTFNGLNTGLGSPFSSGAGTLTNLYGTNPLGTLAYAGMYASAYGGGGYGGGGYGGGSGGGYGGGYQNVTPLEVSHTQVSKIATTLGLNFLARGTAS